MSVSMRDIARKAGVSHATVSLALRGHPRISLARRKQITRLAATMGYEPDLIARAMRTGRTRTVGLLMSNLHTRTSNSKAEAVEAALASEGFRALIAFTQGETPRLMDCLRDMLARRVDAIIVTGQAPDSLTEGLTRKIRAPLVLVDASPQSEDLPGVDTDRVAGFRNMADYLRSLGHRDLAFFGRAGYEAQPKIQGIRQALQDDANDVRLHWIQLQEPGWRPAEEFQVHSTRMTIGPRALSEAAQRKGMEIAGRKDRPTAILAASDFLAMGLILGLQAGGVRVPQDVSVTGFDDTDDAVFFRPALTTLRQPCEDIGQKAVAMLIKLLEGKDVTPRHERLVPDLVVRESSASPSKKRTREGGKS